jgi:hypothetical protein
MDLESKGLEFPRVRRSEAKDLARAIPRRQLLLAEFNLSRGEAVFHARHGFREVGLPAQFSTGRGAALALSSFKGV